MMTPIKIEQFQPGDFIRMAHGKTFERDSIVLLEPVLHNADGAPDKNGTLLPCAIRYSAAPVWTPMWLPFIKVQGIWGNMFDSTRYVFPMTRPKKSIVAYIKAAARSSPSQSGKLVMPLTVTKWQQLSKELGLVLDRDKPLELALEGGKSVEVFLSH